MYVCIVVPLGGWKADRHLLEVAVGRQIHHRPVEMWALLLKVVDAWVSLKLVLCHWGHRHEFPQAHKLRREVFIRPVPTLGRHLFELVLE